MHIPANHELTLAYHIIEEDEAQIGGKVETAIREFPADNFEVLHDMCLELILRPQKSRTTQAAIRPGAVSVQRPKTSR